MARREDFVEHTGVKVIVLVKAAPVLTRELAETMCVAGIRVDADAPGWIRLHPVPFRDLENVLRFAKYQAVEASVIRPRSDRRPESWKPIQGSITLGETLDTANGWAARRHIVEQLPEQLMCELVESNRHGSGPGVASLAVVRPIDPPTLVITERDPAQIREWQRRAAGAEARVSLFEDPDTRKPPFEVVPWRFRYHYRCGATGCNGHQQTIVDWEFLALWRHVRSQSDWQDRMKQKFEVDLWNGRDTVLFVGNQEQHPVSFLVLGVFWPPTGPIQSILAI
ncbi:MAG: hypothetical protein ACR2H3_03875 [Acidimicrobiales bacterium]